MAKQILDGPSTYRPHKGTRAKLRRIAHQNKRDISSLVREALDDYLLKYEAVRPMKGTHDKEDSGVSERGV